MERFINIKISMPDNKVTNVQYLDAVVFMLKQLDKDHLTKKNIILTGNPEFTAEFTSNLVCP